MKKIILPLTALILATTGVASAESYRLGQAQPINAAALAKTGNRQAPQVTNNNYVDAGYNAKTVTVSQLAGLYDETPVVIAGKITRALGDEKYELQDRTGKVIVEIDDDIAFPNQLVGKSVVITGELDVSKKSGRIKIDADMVDFK